MRVLLTAQDLNVVTVDWSGGSQALYSQATTNTRLVGLEVAHFIHFLKDKFGLDPGDVHIIGHSLGSHTAGVCGVGGWVGVCKHVNMRGATSDKLDKAQHGDTHTRTH